MNTRAFGKTGYTVGEFGLACWQLGGTDWSGLSDMRAHSILLDSANHGVNFFDTADVYGGGRSESVIGHFLKDHKDTALVATKVGRAHGMFPNGYTWEAVRSATEDSLTRLDLPVIPLSQLHCVPTEVLKDGEIFDWMRRLQSDGKIEHFGASVETVEEALICLEQPGLASLQVIFNVFRQKPLEEVFPLAKEKGVALIVRLPLADGLLGGHLTGQGVLPPPTDPGFPNRDRQLFTSEETFCGLPFDRGLELASKLQAMLPHDLTLPLLALRYILDHDAVSVVIPSSSRSTQTTVNAQASKLPPLPPELHAELKAFYLKEVAPSIRGPY